MHTPAVAATWRFALLFASMATATTVDAGHQRIVTTNNVVLTGANSDPGADGRSYGVNGWASYAGENGSQGGTLYVHTTGSITVQGTIDLRGGNGGSATASPHAAGSKGGDGGWGGV